MSFVDAILSFDGKSVSELKSAMRNSSNNGAWTQIVPFFSSDVQYDQSASTWLVKAGLEAGREIKHGVLDSMIDSAVRFVHWEPKLHVLQCVQYFGDGQMQHVGLKEFVASQLVDKKLLVRVWAFDAAVRIALFEGNDHAARKYMEAVDGDSPASMRARARRLRQEFAQLR